MNWYKRIVGDRLRAKSPGSQVTEATIAVSTLKRMLGLGAPDSEAVVASRQRNEARLRSRTEPCTNAPYRCQALIAGARC